jgi:hypothetical protein
VPQAPQYQAPVYPPAPPVAPQYQPPQPAYQPPAQAAPPYQAPQQGYVNPTAPYPPVPAAPPQYQAQGYAQPSAAYGQQQNYAPGQASASAAVPPAGYDQGYGGYQGDYEQWPAEPKKRNTAVIVLSVLLAVVLIGGAGVGVYLYTHKSASTPPAPPKAQTCVVSNNGNPVEMIPASCGPGTYTILSVFTGTADTNACANVSGVTNYYTFTWPSSSAYDYVLCLKRQ